MINWAAVSCLYVYWVEIGGSTEEGEWEDK